MEQAITDYLAHLNIPISKRYCEKCIVSHPDYPSLLSIADTLERLGIVHQIGEVENDVEEVPLPCMFQLDRRGGELLLVKDKNDLKRLKSDLKHWKGVVLKIDPASDIIDKKHNDQHEKEKSLKKIQFGLLVCLIGGLILSVIYNFSWLNLGLVLTSIAGAITGYILVAKDLGITYQTIETFCTSGEKTNCNKILYSKAAQLFGPINISDVVLSYFGFQLLTLVWIKPFFSNSTSLINALALASIAAIPAIVYSIYYQYVKANTWCRLCLLVDLILLLQVIVFFCVYYKGLIQPEAISVIPLLFSAFLFLTIGSTIVLLKEKLKKIPVLEQKEMITLRVKNSSEVFAHLLFQGKKVNVEPLEAEMRIGNPNAPIQILMVASLMCGPCKVGFEMVSQIVSTHPKKVSLILRFHKSGKERNGLPIASDYLIKYWHHHFYDSYDSSTQTKKLIIDWYENQSIKNFIRKYSMKRNNSEIAKLAESHYNWIKEANITKTPTYFINGRILPKYYKIEDLFIFVPALTEYFSSHLKANDNGFVSEKVRQKIT